MPKLNYLMHASGVRRGMAHASNHLRHFVAQSSHANKHVRHMLADGLHRMVHKHHSHHLHGSGAQRRIEDSDRKISDEGLKQKKKRQPAQGK